VTVVRETERDDLLRVLNFRREQIAVLESDLGWRAFQVHEDPAVQIGPSKGFGQA
jgi:hypothetical protein